MSNYPQVCLGKSTQETLLGGVCLPDLLKFHLKFGPLAPAECEIMQVGQQANRPGIVVPQNNSRANCSAAVRVDVTHLYP
jgi:hypothetical protein